VRYQKGSIGLTNPKDKAILNFVADSIYVTHWQLHAFLMLDQSEGNKRVFNWRIRRLVRRGLVRKQVLPFLNGQALYSITRAGIQALEQLGVYFLGANLDRERDAREAEIPHALEVNYIRLALLCTGSLWQWIPEPFIRALNLSPSACYAKVYDGIAKVRLAGESVSFAIEYERTLKSQAKYDKIFNAIESEERLQGFFYFVPTHDLVWSLIDEFRRTRRLIFFGLVDALKQKLFDAEVRAVNHSTMSLREALLRVIALEKSKRQRG
jgi:hypothetical protein